MEKRIIFFIPFALSIVLAATIFYYGPLPIIVALSLLAVCFSVMALFGWISVKEKDPDA